MCGKRICTCFRTGQAVWSRTTHTARGHMANDDPLIRASVAHILMCLKGDRVLQRLEEIVENEDLGAEEIREALAQARGND